MNSSLRSTLTPGPHEHSNYPTHQELLEILLLEIACIPASNTRSTVKNLVFMRTS